MDHSTLPNATPPQDVPAAGEMSAVVYQELRSLAAQMLVRESPGQSLQPTSLVHEAYLRLAGGSSGGHWTSKRHFFGAAAEAMRRILVESARRRKSLKRSGKSEGNAADVALDSIALPDVDVLAIHEGLDELVGINPEIAELVKLRFFAGLTQQEAAVLLEISERTAKRHWAFARGWLYERLKSGTNVSAP
ncbi:MAG: ECF-type sigma factor [Planctomycetota bacterium]